MFLTFFFSGGQPFLIITPGRLTNLEGFPQILLFHFFVF